MNNKQIKVTQPLLPPLEQFLPYLQKIWESKWLTNNGDLHQELERELCNYLRVENLSLFTNGTLPLITALQALEIKGEVITTSYSFVATTHALWWNGIEPLFVDIDPVTLNIDPKKIEEAITPRTTAIMPVHVYGNPCDIEAIDKIAKKYNLKVIYDAAHAFGVTINGKSILEAGDISTLSFHATKTYNTAEGGATVCNSAELKKEIDYLKNFGFAGETTVLAPGINAKMDEIRSALGLLNLTIVDEAIAKRGKIAKLYREGLKQIEGISFMEDIPGVRHNYSYFPIFIDQNSYSLSRDQLYEKLKDNNIYGRRYFYPLISQFAPYLKLKSAAPANLPIAHRTADSVICLPMHHELEEQDVERIVEVIKQ